MKPLITMLFCFFLFNGLTQTLSVSKQFAIGGNLDEIGSDFIPLANGNFVVASSSISGVSGNKLEDGFGLYDYWVFEISSTGEIVWQTVIGGADYEFVASLYQTLDGGFIITGNSKSGATGNKTTPNYGNNDCWVVKLDSSGEILWQNSFGGIQYDFGGRILEQDNGQFFLGMTSTSGISGNKTIESKGGFDLWIVKLDANGNELDQFGFGGDDADHLSEMKFIGENEIHITATSRSGVSGNKTLPGYGYHDIWVLRIDTLGNELKSQIFGGTAYDYSAATILRPNGDLVLSGSSSSGVSGNKSAKKLGGQDYWLMLVDSNLDIKWDSAYGGEHYDWCTGPKSLVFSEKLNLFIQGGRSMSNISGNKSIAPFDSLYDDIWIVGVSPTGEKEFEFVAGGVMDEDLGGMIATDSGTVWVLGNSYSDTSGNKLVQNIGDGDIWLFELDFDLHVDTICDNSDLTVFPIPASRTLNFSSPIAICYSDVTLTDISGNIVYVGTIREASSAQIDVSHLSQGVYILRVLSEEFRYTRKIVIE